MAEEAAEEALKMTEDTEMFVRKQAKKDNNWTAGKFKNFSFAANSITGFRLDQEVSLSINMFYYAFTNIECQCLLLYHYFCL